MIDSTKDGVHQMADALANRHGITAVHIISHGNSANLYLGTADLNTQSMQSTYAADLSTIKGSLGASADILVYGCDFAKGTAGQQAANALAAITGADVAASTNLTGSVSGADWTLESRTGAITTATISAADWQHDLITVTATDGSGSGYVNTPVTGTLTGQGMATAPSTSVSYALADANGIPLPLNTIVTTAHGTVRITDAATGAYVFTPANGYAGSDTFVFTVSATDPVTGDVATGTAFEQISIAAPAIAVQNDTAHAGYNRPVSGTIVPDVIANPTGAALNYSMTQPTANGIVVFNPDGTYTYTPNSGFYGNRYVPVDRC